MKPSSSLLSRSSLALARVYVAQQKKLLIAGLLAMMVGITLYMQIPPYLKQAVDGVAQHKPLHRLWGPMGMILLLTLLQGVGRFFSRVWVVTASRNFEYHLRQDLWAHLLHRDPAFFDRHYTGDLMARLSNDLNAVRMAFGPALMYAAYAALSLVWALGYMFYLQASLTLVVLTPVSLCVGLMFLVLRWVRPRHQHVQEAFSDLSRSAQETFTGLRDIKAFIAEAPRERQFAEIADRYIIAQRRLTQIQSIPRSLILLLTGLGFLTLLFYGGRQIALRQLSLGTYVAFQTYLSMVVWPLLSLGWIANLWQRGRASLDRLGELIDFSTYSHFTESSTLNEILPLGNGPGPVPHGDLTVRQLTFSYTHEDPPVLHQIDMELNAGHWLAIVGPPRSGKSTLLKVLVGLYPNYAGSIFWGGTSLKELDQRALRSSLIYVPQEAVLFSRTIRENLVLGMESNPPAESDIMEVLNMTCFLRDLEKMPQGLDTMIGERGVNLSGGQRQRLALARALLRKPRVLLLDDPFAQVDVETEYAVWSNIQRHWRRRCTLIFISQRVSLTLNCDYVLVLENGHRVDFGPPDEVRKREGWYATAVQLQERLRFRVNQLHQQTLTFGNEESHALQSK